MQALDQGDIYYDPTLGAVLQAEGTVDTAYLTHNFTMLWPSYGAANIHDSMVKRLIPAQYDPWGSILEYFDTAANATVKIDLKNSVTSQHSISININNSTVSQQNLGWPSTTQTEEKKKQKFPFAAKSILFHKNTKTKWIFDEIDSVTNHPVLRSFYNKQDAMQIFENEYDEFEEIFF